MRVAIVGSRPEYAQPGSLELTDETSARHHACWAYVANLPLGSMVISGGAAGVDAVAIEAAKFAMLGWRVIRPKWKLYGKRAGPMRNAEIVAWADRVVAFWDGVSRGTLSTINLAREAGKPVEVYGPGGSRMLDMEKPL